MNAIMCNVNANYKQFYPQKFIYEQMYIVQCM